MKKSDFVIITFKGIEYKINLEKLEIVLSALEQKDIKIRSEEDYKPLLKKYHLYDEGFFENVNRI